MKKDKIVAVFSKDIIMAPEGDLARELYNKNRFGEIRGNEWNQS